MIEITHRINNLHALKIRVSVVRLIQIGQDRSSPFGQLRYPDSLRESVRPWPPFIHEGSARSLSSSRVRSSRLAKSTPPTYEFGSRWTRAGRVRSCCRIPILSVSLTI